MLDAAIGQQVHLQHDARTRKLQYAGAALRTSARGLASLAVAALAGGGLALGCETQQASTTYAGMDRAGLERSRVEEPFATVHSVDIVLVSMSWGWLFIYWQTLADL
jgi:hypothetical protein